MRHRFFQVLSVRSIFGTGLFCLCCWLIFLAPAMCQAMGVSEEKAKVSLATLERGWVENVGQWDEKAAFSATGYFGTTWVTRDGELRHVASKREDCEKQTPEAREPDVAFKRFRKACPSQSWVLSERWVGGKVKGIGGEEGLETKVSYFIGNDPAKHRSGLPTYRYVSLGEVWPGVELKLKASEKTVEKLFYIAPGVDLEQVKVELEGARGLRLSDGGEILVETDLGELKLSKPVAWQEKEGEKLLVQASYRLLSENRYGFVVAGVDPSLPLIIDPILQCTYLGGNDYDAVRALAIHPSTGEVYVAGDTDSTDFPNTAGGAQANYGGFRDAFVARLNSSLTRILQSTYLGGSGGDFPCALAIHPSTGDVYVAGYTSSSNFPDTAGGAQASHGGSEDAFVARLNSTLNQILQSTYLGGNRYDMAYALAIHPSTGDVYVAGDTDSTDFPNTAGGAQANYGGGEGEWKGGDAFVARLNSSLTQILQSTYLGGSEEDKASALAIHPSTGDVYVAGDTVSTDFPNTAGGAQASYGGSGAWGGDAFVARLNSSLTSILQSTYLGGSAGDLTSALAISGGGDVYVAGITRSTDFPNTAGGAQPSSGGSWDAFVARLNAGLTQNLQSTYLGGSASDGAHALAIGPAPNYEVYVAGPASSTNFPNTNHGAQPSYGGGTYDVFVARLNAALTSNPQSTYLGGSGEDDPYPLAVHPSTGEVYVAGYSSSTDLPNTAGGAQPSYGGGGWDAFVARLSADLAGAYELSIDPKPINGTVISNPPGINCGSGGSDCSESYTGHTLVILTATPDPGYTFGGWGGDCSPCGTNSECQVPMDRDTNCSAIFTYNPPPVPQYTLTVTKSGTGTGTVTSSPEGISCGADCSEAYTAGTTVTLTATPDTDSVFSGWSGDCSGTDPAVTVIVDGEKSCIATFSFASGPDLTGRWERLAHTCKNTRSGPKCKLSGTLRVGNRGDQAAPPGALVYFYLSSDGTWDSGDSLLKQVAVGALKAGRSKTRKLSYALPLGESAQGKYVIAWIDATGAVAETNEANNMIVSEELQ